MTNYKTYQGALSALEHNVESLDSEPKKTAILLLIYHIKKQKNIIPEQQLLKVLNNTIGLVNGEVEPTVYDAFAKKMAKKYQDFGNKMALTGAIFIICALLASFAALGSIALPFTAAVVMIPVATFLLGAFVLGLMGRDKIDTYHYVAKHKHPLTKFNFSLFEKPISEEKEIEVDAYQYS